MSLDVTLTDPSGTVLYEANITHNLNKMAAEAGIYECLWRPDEHGITHARQIIDPDEATSPGVQPGVERSSRNGLFNLSS